MGQPYTCDNADGTLAFVVMTQPETGDVTALCAPCLLEWSFSMLTQSEIGLDLLKAKMLEMVAAEQAAAAKPRARRPKPASTSADEAKDTEPAGPGESTPGAD